MLLQRVLQIFSFGANGGLQILPIVADNSQLTIGAWPPAELADSPLAARPVVESNSYAPAIVTITPRINPSKIGTAASRLS